MIMLPSNPIPVKTKTPTRRLPESKKSKLSRQRSLSHSPIMPRRKAGQCPMDAIKLERAPHSLRPLLSVSQKTLIRESWQKMAKFSGPGSIGASIFRCLSANCPSVKPVLGFGCPATLQFDPQFDRHSVEMMTIINSTVMNLNKLESMVDCELMKVGKIHSVLTLRGFDPEIWDSFGQAIVDGVSEWVGPGRKHRETLRAWTIIATYIVGKLRIGHEIGTRNFEVKRSPKYLKNYTFYNELNPSFPSSEAIVTNWMNEKEITCLIDIGANVGAVTSIGASRNKTVIAVEPLPINLANLYKIIQERKWADRVYVLPYAMSDHRTLVQMTNELQNNYQTTYIKHKDNKPGIPNLDGNIDVYAITFVDLIPFALRCKKTAIKIDVQGHECYVLKDSSPFFKQIDVPYIAMEWNLASRVDPECNKAMIKTLKSVNFLPFYLNGTIIPHDIFTESIEKPNRDLYDIIWRKIIKVN